VPVINKFIPLILYVYHNSLILIITSKFTRIDTQMCGKLQKMINKEMLILEIHKLEIYLFTVYQNLFYSQKANYVFIYLRFK
jgi:hypothetical protein